MANCGQGEQEMPEALESATFIWSTGPGVHQETQTRQLGRLRVESSPWPGASNETIFLVPAGGTKNEKQVYSCPPPLSSRISTPPGPQSSLPVQ